MSTPVRDAGSIVGIGRSGPAPLDAVGWLTFFLVLLFFIPSRLVVGPLGSAGAPSMLFGLGSLLFWLLLYLRGSRSSLPDSNPIRMALGIFLFCAGVSYVIAVGGPMSPDELSPADVAMLSLAAWSGTLLLAHDGIGTRDRLDLFLWRLAVAGGLIGLIGILQVLTRQPLVDQIAIPGLTSTPVPGLFTRGPFPRPSGTAIHPIEYGVLVTVLLPIALHVGFTHTHRRLVVRWLPAVALAAVIPFTSSRSAYLGAIVALTICMLGWSRERRLRVLSLVVAGIVAMSVVTPNFLRSVVNLFTGASEDPSIASRTGSFDLAAQFIAQDPLFGRGLGTFLPKYRIFDNQYLLLLVTVGVVGTLAFIAIGVTAVVSLLRLRARLRDDAGRDLATAFTASIATGFVCLVMFDAFAFPMTMATLFLILGLAGGFRRIERERWRLAALLQ